MRYLILIYGNPASREVWETFTPEEQRAGLDVYAALNEDLAASGEMVVSQRLADVAHTKRVSVRNGETLVSDGPFAEAKEHLAGFYLIDCVDRARRRRSRPGSRSPRSGWWRSARCWTCAGWRCEDEPGP
jgi:hypothetical protein